MGKYYLTTPIYYVNAKPHLGHAYTTIVSDALARWHRMLGDDVYFLTGTDEHGLKIQQAADAAGTSPKEFADSIAPLFRQAWERLNISNDDFIRTTEERHRVGVQKLLQACFDAGDIELDTYSGLYCVACEAYYVEDDLDGGNCPIHKKPVEHVEEENYFFRLSRFEQRLLDWYSSHPGAVVPDHRVNEVIGFIKQGLNDFSVSRRTLTWGIPLPFDESHVAYVWFDALANYITAVGYGTDDEKFARWWPVNHHVIGKDIVRFHNVYWPAMLMSAGIEPPQGWAVGGWLLVGGEKMSKTTGNVVNPLDLIDEIGVDGFRYYVLADTTYGSDGDFTYEGLIGRYNSDLANNLGNLAARVATVVGKKCGGLGTAPDPASPLADHARAAVEEALAQWEAVQPSRALEATWGLIRATNAHLETNEPWKAEAGPQVDTVMGDALEALRIVTILCFAAIPDTARLAGVERFVVIGTDAVTSSQAIAIAAQHADVWATVGLHPHDATKGADTVAHLAASPRVVGIGECGLDYHYENSPRDAQLRAFADQIALAKEHGLSLVIHTRDAWQDTYDVLDAEGIPENTIIHCFSGGPEEARRCLDRGAYLSFSGIVTFKNASELRDAASLCPLDRMLVETDAPFLAPVPHRGRPNEPAHVAVVGTAIADLRGMAPAELAAVTSANALRAFPRIGS